MTMKNEALFWKKKEYVSFLLSILVFFIHSNFIGDIIPGSLISVINNKVFYFFTNSITRFAVPMFFMMSGVTFFKDYDNKKYPLKIKSRIFTLIIPYLLWNTIWMLWEIFTSYSFLSGFSTDAVRYPLTLINILKGVFFYGCNIPFWFIFDLIIFSFGAPLVFLIIKNKYVGIISVIILSLVSIFGIHLPTSLFYYPMAIVFYMMGGIIGCHFFDFAACKSKKPVQIGSFIFLSVYILAKNIAPEEIHITNYLIQTVVYTLAAFSLWSVTDIFIESLKPRAIYRRSFAVYAMHLPIAIIILKILTVCTSGSEWFEIPKFIIMVISTLVIINTACILLEKFSPGIYGVLMGNRVKKNK